jgi:hypothetical protein
MTEVLETSEVLSLHTAPLGQGTGVVIIEPIARGRGSWVGPVVPRGWVLGMLQIANGLVGGLLAGGAGTAVMVATLVVIRAVRRLRPGMARNQKALSAEEGI